MSYEELISALRYCDENRSIGCSDGCKYWLKHWDREDKTVTHCHDQLVNDAINAIVELCKTVQRDTQIVEDLRKHLNESEADNVNLTGWMAEEHAKRLAAEQDAERLANRLMEEHTLLRDCRNELCIKCGRYTQRHLGFCDNCRWKVVA